MPWGLWVTECWGTPRDEVRRPCQALRRWREAWLRCLSPCRRVARARLPTSASWKILNSCLGLGWIVGQCPLGHHWLAGHCISKVLETWGTFNEDTDTWRWPGKPQYAARGTSSQMLPGDSQTTYRDSQVLHDSQSLHDFSVTVLTTAFSVPGPKTWAISSSLSEWIMTSCSNETWLCSHSNSGCVMLHSSHSFSVS